MREFKFDKNTDFIFYISGQLESDCRQSDSDCRDSEPKAPLDDLGEGEGGCRLLQRRADAVLRQRGRLYRHRELQLLHDRF